MSNTGFLSWSNCQCYQRISNVCNHVSWLRAFPPVFPQFLTQTHSAPRNSSRVFMILMACRDLHVSSLLMQWRVSVKLLGFSYIKKGTYFENILLGYNILIYDYASPAWEWYTNFYFAHTHVYVFSICDWSHLCIIALKTISMCLNEFLSTF